MAAAKPVTHLPTKLDPQAAGRIAYEAHAAARKARSAEANLPPWSDLPGEYRSVWADTAVAMAGAAAGRDVVGPDPEFSRAERALIKSLAEAERRRITTVAEGEKVEQGPVDALDALVAKL